MTPSIGTGAAQSCTDALDEVTQLRAEIAYLQSSTTTLPAG